MRFGGAGPHFFLVCGGVVFLLGFLQKSVARCGVFVVRLWCFVW